MAAAEEMAAERVASSSEPRKRNVRVALLPGNISGAGGLQRLCWS